MKFSRPRSLQGKLSLAVILASGSALFLACSILVLRDWIDYRGKLQSELELRASVMGSSLTAAVAFEDDEAVRTMLATFAHDEPILSARVTDADGRTMAEFRRDRSERGPSAWFGSELGATFPIQFAGEYLGELTLVSSLAGLGQRIAHTLLITATVFLVSALVAWAVGARLQSTVLRPVLRLLAVVRRVSETRDYSIRARHESHGDVGVLVRGFNQMIETVEQRDLELLEAREVLERRVEDRTVELRQEIADRQRAEEDARMMGLFAELNPSPVLRFDATGTITLANPAAKMLLGASPGVRLEQLLPELDDLDVEWLVTQGAQEVRFVEFGSAIYLLQLCGIRAKGAANLYAHDVTRLRETERELEEKRDEAVAAARLKSEFLANMSHEIRTPLNGILGMSGLLSETKLDSEQREYLHAVRTSGEALLTLINDILDFSKVEAGKLDLECIPFSVSDVVEDAVELLAPAAAEKGLELVVSRDARTPEAIAGDPGRVRQILLNLVSNAIKFTEDGLVHVRVEPAADDDRFVRLSVTDSGIGIAAEYRDYVFEEFTQEDASTTRRFGGTGLGLAICRRLVELMGGEIGVESEVGHGSEFWFHVPVGDTVDMVPPRTAPREYPVRVLLVESHAVTRRALEEQLESLPKVHVATAAAPRALAELREAKRAGRGYDALWVGQRAGEVDAAEMARELARDAEIADTRVVALLRPEERKAGTWPAGCAFVSRPARRRAVETALRSTGREAVEEPSVAAPAKSELVAEGGAASAPPETKVTLRVLVVEDQEVNQRLAEALLAREGCDVVTVATGIQAVERAKQEDWDLILMDCQLPGLDGYAATRAIRKFSGARASVRIAAMTASAMSADRERCRDAGMDDFLAKPIVLAQLRALLEQVRTTVAGASGD